MRLSDMRETVVSLGDTPLRGMKAWVTDYRWNGWQCPYFSPDVVRAHRAQFEEYAKITAELISDEGLGERFSWNEETDLPSIVTVWEDGDETEEVGTVVTDSGTQLVTIGWGFFTWEEDEDE